MDLEGTVLSGISHGGTKVAWFRSLRYLKCGHTLVLVGFRAPQTLSSSQFDEKYRLSTRRLLGTRPTCWDLYESWCCPPPPQRKCFIVRYPLVWALLTSSRMNSLPVPRYHLQSNSQKQRVKRWFEEQGEGGTGQWLLSGCKAKDRQDDLRNLLHNTVPVALAITVRCNLKACWEETSC